MKKIYIILFCILNFISAHAQQNAQYTQYMFNNIYINPGYTGYRGDVNLHSFLRSQWVEIKGAPQTLSLALDGSVNDDKVGLGLQLVADKIGAQSTLSAYALYAYRLKFGYASSSSLSFGIGAGVIQNGLDGSLLETLNPDDPLIPSASEFVTLPDAKFGVFYADETFFAGFSVDNLIAQYAFKESNYSTYFPSPKAHFYLQGGFVKPINDQVRIMPSFLLKDDLGGPTSLDVNSLFLLNDEFRVGAGYRTSVKLYNKDYLQNGLLKPNTVIAMLEVMSLKNMRIGYSVEFGVRGISGARSQTHELSLTYQFKRRNEKRMLDPRVF